MHRAASLGMSTGLAALIVASVSAPASACYSCGYDYAPGYAYAPPVYAYAAPPAYSYYAPSAYEYYERVNVFRGPRWNYSAAYYNSPILYGGIWRSRAYGYHGAPRVYARPYRGYVRGPIVRAGRRW